MIQTQISKKVDEVINEILLSEENLIYFLRIETVLLAALIGLGLPKNRYLRLICPNGIFGLLMRLFMSPKTF